MHKRSRLRISRLTWCCLLIGWLLVACRQDEPIVISQPNTFPNADAFSGWTTDGEIETFGQENIYDLVNGQADAFFAYGFEQVMVQNYENTDGTVLSIEIWQLATPSDAYGLFTTTISGEPVVIGNEGDADPGRRLIFWQDRFYIHLRARQEVPDADLWSLAAAVSAALPSGGQRPALMDQLPAEGLVERSAIFFHEEISIQNEIWLGGENLLGLSPETEGVLARYEVGDTLARLLLVDYPDAEMAAAGHAALRDGQISDAVASDTSNTLLGVVFGEVDRAKADALLTAALQ
jgi:hypothetical protein